MFESIYASSWHNPGLFWLACALLIFALARRMPFLIGYLVVFAFVIAADALASGGLSPVGASTWATPIAIAFVLLGDFRYFLLVERVGGKSLPAAMVAAIPISFVVPVASYAAGVLVPALGTPVRVTYLVYEVMFLALALSLRFVVLPRRLASATPGARSFLLAVTSFEIAQYALWALADVVILSGSDLGFAMRLVPNTMYYALFLPFVLLRAPAELKLP